MSNPPAPDKDWHSYKSIGTNVRDAPDGEWVRVSLSPSGNKEIWACHALQITQEIISD
jgi:hypothetical protein